MRSLVITRWGPNRADGGAALRNMQNIRALARLGPVDVLSVGGDETVTAVQDVAAWTHFRRAEGRRGGLPWVAVPGRHPLTDRYLHPAALRHVAALPRGAYDVAVIEEIALAGYVAPLGARGIPVVFDAHNVEARLRADIDQAAGRAGGLAGRVRSWLLDRRLGGVEARAVRAAEAVWACSEIDADLLRQTYRPRAPVTVVPNAVDVAAYAPALAAHAAEAADAVPALLYIGTYSYPPNAAAALRLATAILPALRARGLDLALVLAGRDPTEAMRAAAAADPRITVTGPVDSILPWLARPNVVVLPITLGSGTRLKILEAFAAGCAVVSTAKGAEGIAIRPGENILIAETDADFVAAIARLAADGGARRDLGRAGWQTVSAQYSWDAAAAAIRASLAAMTAAKTGAKTGAPS